MAKSIWWWLNPIPNLRGLLPRPSGGWEVIKSTLRRPKMDKPTMTFAEVCRKYRVTEDGLRQGMIRLRKRRRLLTVFGWLNIGLFLLGFPLLHLNMIILGLLSAIACFVYATLFQVRLWQCQRRDLAGVEAFLADRQALVQVFLW